MEREIDNIKNRNIAVNLLIEDIDNIISSLKKELETLQMNFHKQRVINQYSNRNFKDEALKKLGFEGFENVTKALNEGTYEKQMNNKADEIKEFESLKSIITEDYNQK